MQYHWILENGNDFEGIEEEIEVIGVNICGGCPGKKAVTTR